MTPNSALNGSEAMSPTNESSTSQKRKSEDAGPQPRAKRNRYISIACNECKRRKIKCNGQTPCARCGNLSLECLYAPNCCNNFKDSDEFKQMTSHISSLQEQVDQLFANLTNLRTHVDTQSVGSIGTPYGTNEHGRSVSIGQNSGLPASPTHQRSKSASKHPRFHGPTSIAFNLDVAKSSLKTMGITGTEVGLDEGVVTQDASPVESPRIPPPAPPKPLHSDKDPIWALTKHEALRLVRVWHDEMGMMYPFMEIDKVLRYAEMLFSFVEAAARSGLMQGGLPGADAILDDQTSTLKLILAIALILEGNGKNALGEKLFENVHKVVERALLDPVDVKGITMLALAAMYHFHRDDEALAWRIIGLAARQCLELGLHRRETYSTIFPDADEQMGAVRTFWSIYVLDRRWSFGTGMPFAMAEADIDPNLPKPDESTSYLNSMIAYSMIGSKVWRSMANVDAAQNQINKEDMSYLDYQVINWHRSIPDDLKFSHPESGRDNIPPPRAVHRLQVALYLRANQMRILIYRPVLHTATSIMENLEAAHTVVKVSKDTIRVLTFINQTTDIYRNQQAMFNWFLISALAVLFLAVAHAPAEFSQQCRDEFYMALDLVRGLSANSFVSKRLWRAIRVLKEVGPRLGLNVRNMDTEDPHSSAAVAMAGLAGHQVDEMALFANGGEGHGMATDLTHLFEAVGNGFPGMMQNGYGLPSADMSNGGELMPFSGHEDELSRIMRDLF